MNKLSRLLLGIAAFFCISTASFAQDLQIQVKAPRSFWNRYAKGRALNVLKPEYNPELSTEGDASIMVQLEKIKISAFEMPTMSIGYAEPNVISSGSAQIASFLKKKSMPRVVVRVPERLQEAKFVEDIEMLLSGLGWTIVDHSLVKGAKSIKEIQTQTAADIILDVSWLKFSDPSMYCQIDVSKSSMSNWNFFYKRYDWPRLHDAYLHFKDEKTFQKWKNNQGPKYEINGCSVEVTITDQTPLKKLALDQMTQYERFNTNKNVVSAIFKFINATDGALLGYYHVGEKSDIKLSGGDKIEYTYFLPMHEDKGGKYFKDYSTFYRENHNEISYDFILRTLSYMDVFLPNGEIPFAAQLNEMEDVKLSDETIVDAYQSSSTTNTSYSGGSRDYYNTYFNSRYYSGRGRGNYAGNSSSTTHSSGSGSTTFKEAEYIRYSDFFGYYKPLTEKFVKEIQKIMQ